MNDLLAAVATVATLGLIARRVFHLLLAHFEPDRPYWVALGKVVAGDEERRVPARPEPVRVVAGVVDWRERGWA